MKYQLIEKEITIDGNTFKAFGIASSDSYVEDISVDREFVARIVTMLNENDVSEIHMREIIEDMLLGITGTKPDWER